MENYADFLYHYTNIETLALILKNHTFRLNSLDHMDDLQEKEASDIKNIGQFCYVSSWTDDKRESIPMWNMYSTLDSGVRIKLRSNPFKLFENTPESIRSVSVLPVTDNSNGVYMKSIIPLADMMKKGYICPAAMSNKILHKVEYTSDLNKLYPKLVTHNGEQFSIALGSLGIQKNIHWEFQHEWRYILQFYPLNINQKNLDSVTASVQIMANKLLYGLEKQPFPFYDLQLDDNAFSEMEITLSPKISVGNRLIVNALVDKYNPSASIHDSSLLGLI